MSVSSMARILAGGKGSAAAPEAVGTVVEGPSAGGPAGLVLVAFDGSDAATPCESVTGVNAGDRVRVALSGGRAVVTGNLTSRATDSKAFARTLGDIPAAINCIKQTDQGLEIGNTDADGNFVGSRTLLGDSLYFLGPGDEVLGEFADNRIRLSECEIEYVGEGELTGLNIFSHASVTRLSCSRPITGEAGSSMRASPPMVEITGSEARMSVGYLVKDSEGGISGSDSNSIVVSADGTDIYGPVRVNGKTIG